MKQHFFSVATALLGGIALLASCNSKSDVENHQMSIQSRDRKLASTLYADQATDTVWVASTESWTSRVDMIKATTEQGANQATTPATTSTHEDRSAGGTLPTAPAAFTIAPKEITVKPGYYIVTPVVITAQVPATQLLQQANLRILPLGGPLNGLSRRINQVGWLNISSPVAAYSEQSKSIQPNFSEVLQQKGGTTRMVFELYDNQVSTHSLTSDADWLTIPANAKQPAKGRNIVELTYGENTGEKPRTATLQLSSGGASTVITYVQPGRPKK